MLRGGVQDWPLRISTVLDYAALNHGAREIVTRTVEGPIHRTNYRELSRRARQVLGALRRMGVGFEDRVGTLAWNTARHMELWYGIGGLGAIYHTVNPRLSEEHIAYIINDADDRMLFTDLTFVPALEARRDDCLKGRKLVVLTDAAHMPNSPLDLLCYEDLIAGESPEEEWAEVPETARVGLCYTSGTTGPPKGVVYTHRSNVLHSLATYGGDVLDLKSTSVILPVVPMYHANAWGNVFSAPMAGAKMVLPGPKLDAVSICELIEQEGVTTSSGVPTVWIDILGQLQAGNYRADTLKRVVIGGSACPGWMIEAFDAIGVNVVHGWGMTEMNPVGTVASFRAGMEELSQEEQLGYKLKQGTPFYGVEMRIVDEDNHELPRDGKSPGRVKVRGLGVVGEYFKGAGGDILDEDGFFDTGDIGTIGDYGYLQLTDRGKDVIKSGGEWISSIDLENIACGHPEVVEAAAIAIPHDRWQERPMLLATLMPGSTLTAEALSDYLAPRMARWWLPDVIEFVDALPHTATGKLDKLSLRKRYADVRLTG